MSRSLFALQISALVACVLVGACLPAQQAEPSTEKTQSSAKLLAFEVISIRPSGPNSPTSWQFLPDGYRATGVPLMVTILGAYFPPPAFRYGNQVKGAPTWVMNERYDIEAKVAPADITEWDKQRNTVAKEKKMQRAMLQALLADRCKFAAHLVHSEVDGHILVVGRHGPKLNDAKPGEDLPDGMNLPDGGVVVSSERDKPPQEVFHHASMEGLRSFLAIHVSGTLENRTGLTGNYDFALPIRPDVPEIQTREPEPQDYYDLDALGLEVKRVKLPGEILTIDHIERPSEN